MRSRLSAATAALAISFSFAIPAGTTLAAHHEQSLEAMLTSASRPDADKARDAGRKPAQVLDFLGITAGQTVVDLMASGGYYTEVLSVAVGPTGTVYAQNPPSFLQWNDGYYDKALTERLEGNRLANVARLDKNLSDSNLGENTIDAAITALNFHDLYNDDPEVGILALKAILPLLKPGGVVGLIDHHGEAGADNAKLHRINIDVVMAAAKAAGFNVDGQSDILLTGQDDHSKGVFDPAVRGKTDRFVLRLVKPE